MKIRQYAENGYAKLVLLRDEDEDLTIGIPIEMPDLAPLSISEAAKREIIKGLVNMRLISWRDIQAGQNLIGGLVSRLAVKYHFDPSPVKRYLIIAYKKRRF